MSRRNEVLGEQIRQILSTAICFEMRDPALEGVTVTRVRVSPDLQVADVRFTWPEEDGDIEPVLIALDRATGALKRIIAAQVRLKRVPNLRFHPDMDVAAERRIGQILDTLDIPPAEDDES